MDGDDWLDARTIAHVELTAYLGTIAGLVTLAVAAMRVVVGQLGRRIEDQGAQLSARIDQQGAQLGTRIDQQGALLGIRIGRLEEQNDAILGAVGDLGQRVAHLEGRSA